jgi:hypothetical protein
MGTIYDNCVNGSSKGWIIYYSGKVVIQWVSNSYLAQCNPYASISSVASLSTGTWYHVAVVMSAANFKIYINGSLDTNYDNIQGVGGASTAGYAPQSNLFISGSVMPYYNGISASMDDVRIYDRELSSSEIQAIYSATK